MQGKAPKATQTGAQPRFPTCWHQCYIQLPLNMCAGTGHQVPNTSVVSEEAQDPEILAFQEHQASAARLSHAEEARTLVAVGKCVLPVRKGVHSANSCRRGACNACRVGVLSTNSSGEATQGYPSGTGLPGSVTFSVLK